MELSFSDVKNLDQDLMDDGHLVRRSRPFQYDKYEGAAGVRRMAIREWLIAGAGAGAVSGWLRLSKDSLLSDAADRRPKSACDAATFETGSC